MTSEANNPLEFEVRANDPLQGLRERVDKRLSCLKADDAAERLRALARQPASLSGKVKAGPSY